MFEFIAIALFACGIWYWWDSMRAKEVARLAGKNACDKIDVQFLDDTVARQKIWLKRNTRGNLIFYRSFNFEFSSLGDQRYHGQITLAGKYISDVKLETHRITE